MAVKVDFDDESSCAGLHRAGWLHLHEALCVPAVLVHSEVAHTVRNRKYLPFVVLKTEILDCTARTLHTYIVSLNGLKI